MTSLPLSGLYAGQDDAAVPPLPADKRPPMPFQKHNRMTTFLVLAVLLLSGMSIMGVRVILRYPNANSTPAWVFLGATVLLALKIVLSMLQTEFATRKLSSEMSHTRHDLRNAMDATTSIIQGAASEMLQKTNGGLKEAVKEAAEQVRAAEHDQILNDPRCLRLVEEAVQKSATLAAENAVRRVMEEMRRGQQ